ncbi:centrosomal protein of 76 kDa [Clonorchis sinensis]|uniref:Centrosomal protein of 76 kDa n=1 Tax=Clonorchis sinensis TaxID=79923 RepID=G7Y6A2_CLOSI|nr:centrosomal protein of 76 kDa [Clonorchis sinensis]
MDLRQDMLWRSLINQVIADEKNAEKISKALNSIPTAGRNSASKEKALEVLRSEGIIDSILHMVLPSVPSAQEVNQPESEPLHSVKPSFSNGMCDLEQKPPFTVGLVVEIFRGTAFIEHIGSYRDYILEEKGQVKSAVIIYLACGRYRACSKLVPFTSEVNFGEEFCFPLMTDTEDNRSTGPQQILLANSTPAHHLHIVVVSREYDTGRTNLVASTVLDWRRHLFHNTNSTQTAAQQPWTASFPLELKSVDPDSKMTAGILDLRLSMVWNLPDTTNRPSNIQPSPSKEPPSPLPPQVVDVQFALESARASQREQTFTLYVRQWWQELTHIREGLISRRLIKLFAVDENSTNQFVCKFVRPLNAQRFVRTPTEAARFVSTIPCEPCRGVGGGPREQWCSTLAFLARNRGDVADHANLLCSLLLGFGLDAYVMIGTRRSCDSGADGADLNDSTSAKSYIWVAVFNVDSSVVLFWDAVSGRRHVQAMDSSCGDRNTSSYKTVDCLYSHNSFYANIQPSNELVSCSLRISDSSHWHPLPSDMISSVTTYSNLVPETLRGPVSNTVELNDRIVRELRALVANWRMARLPQEPPNTWVWDEELCRMMSPVLAGFEADHLLACMALEAEMSSSTTCQLEARLNMAAIHNYVPEGYTFKAYPIQVLHTNPKRILQTSVRSRLCRDILTCHGIDVRLGLCVLVYSYAEEATATWVMFACIYKSAL